MNSLGTIFYNYDAIDITTVIDSDLFKDLRQINQGCESLVYDAGDYVYKVKKLGFIGDLKKQLELLEIKNKTPIFLYEEPIGYLTHLLEPSIKHLVTKQKKINPLLCEETIPITLAFIKQGWIPQVALYEKEDKVIFDIRPENCGLDEEGNFKVIDCMIYTK